MMVQLYYKMSVSIVQKTIQKSAQAIVSRGMMFLCAISLFGLMPVRLLCAQNMDLHSQGTSFQLMTATKSNVVPPRNHCHPPARNIPASSSKSSSGAAHICCQVGEFAGLTAAPAVERSTEYQIMDFNLVSPFLAATDWAQLNRFVVQARSTSLPPPLPHIATTILRI